MTRYFGGIKLGTGGLARAYRDSARAGLEQARIITILVCDRFRVVFPLTFTNIILRTLSADGIKTISSNYTDRGEIIFDVRKSKTEEIEKLLISSTEAKIELEKLSDKGS